MRAIILEHTGGTENFETQDVARPEVLPTQVLVKVKTIGINPVDIGVRSSDFALDNFLKRDTSPDKIILGWDISGVVEETGYAVQSFKPGDEVFGMVNFPGHGKAYAEYVAVDADQLGHKPALLSHEEAAGSNLAALTAYQGLFEYAGIKTDETIIITGASGGVGHFAVQMAKNTGASVIGVASAANREFVLNELGADEFIDYRTQDYSEVHHYADVVFDAIAVKPEEVRQPLRALRRGGRLITLKAQLDDQEVRQIMKEKEITGHHVAVHSSGEDMNALAELFAQGKLKTHVQHIYGFDEMPNAHEAVASGHTRGKVVVNV